MFKSEGAKTRSSNGPNSVGAFSCMKSERSAEKINASDLRHNLVAKSFKSTRKKEDSKHFSRDREYKEHQVPPMIMKKNFVCVSPEKNENKTKVSTVVPVVDTAYSDVSPSPSPSLSLSPSLSSSLSSSNGPKEPVLVRETKASRLRAAKRIPTLKSCYYNRKPLQENLFFGRSHHELTDEKIVMDKHQGCEVYSKNSHSIESFCGDGRIEASIFINGPDSKHSGPEPFSLNDSQKKHEVLPTSSINRKILNSSCGSTLDSVIYRNSSNLEKRFNAKGLIRAEEEKGKITPKEKVHSFSSGTRASKRELLHKIEGDKIQLRRIDIKNPVMKELKPKEVKCRNVNYNVKGHLSERTENRKAEGSSEKIRIGVQEKFPKRVITSNKSTGLPIRMRGFKSEGSNVTAAKNKSVLLPTDSPAVLDWCVRPAFPKKTDVVKPSILKNKPMTFYREFSENKKSKPLSILKKKCFLNDETFSHSTLKEKKDSERQGILKKRRSFDENEILRNRSNSLDAKPILKNQRRCSMEELTRRMHFSDSVCPQGILRPKREMESEDVRILSGVFSEPQGILKRKQSVNDPVFPQFVKSSKCSSVDCSERTPETQSIESVRPILKKKTSSEEQSALDHLMTEAPKSILKKKKSWEYEELEEKPKKPILKTCRTLSIDEPEGFPRNIGSFIFSSESVKSILKRVQEGRSTNAHRLENNLLSKQIVRGRHYFSGSENGVENLGVVIAKRRSLDSQSLEIRNFGKNHPKLKRPSSSEILAFSLPYDEEILKLKYSSADKFHYSSFNGPEDLLSSVEISSTEIDKSTADSKGDMAAGLTDVAPSIEKSESTAGSLRQEKKWPHRGCDPVECCEDERHSIREETFPVNCNEETIPGLNLRKSIGNNEKGAQIKNIKETDFKKFHKNGFASATAFISRYSEPKSETAIEGEEKKQDAKDRKHKDEASDISQLVALFKTTFSSESSLNSFIGRRSTRFCTQPVTSREIEKAKNRNRYLLIEAESSAKSKAFTLEGHKHQCQSATVLGERSVSFVKLENSFAHESNNSLRILKLKNAEISSENENFPKKEETNSDEQTGFETGSTKKEIEMKSGSSLRFSPGNPSQKSSRNNSPTIVKSQSTSVVSSVLRSDFTNSSKEVTTSLKEKNEKDLKEIREQPRKDDEVQSRAESSLKRSLTRTFRPSEYFGEDDMNGATIQERLDRLKKNGELGWQNRKWHGANAKDELSINPAENRLCKVRDSSKKPQSLFSEDSKLTSLAERLNKLGAAQSGWKKRIQQSDAISFSVEGKMVSQKAPNAPNPVLFPPKTTRQKRSPRPVKFRSKDCNISPDSVGSVAKTEEDDGNSTSCEDGEKGLLDSGSKNFKMTSGIITIPKNDDETFTSFFNGLSYKPSNRERVEIKDEDLDVVAPMNSSHLLVQRKNIKMQKRKTVVRNPLKSLASRLESQEYTESKACTSRNEIKKFQTDKGEIISNMAIEALAGLASQEDFTAINLKKTSEGNVVFPDAPYKDLMLLHVKGRRHVQTRLVEPVASSINAGDCFILVAGNKVFNYIGKFANVIERSRSVEISCHIQQKGDLGCSAETVVTVGESGKATKEQANEFWNLLGGTQQCERGPGNADEDELFESCLPDTNMVYELVDDELVPVESFWGSIPKYEILDSHKVLVFDFGSEFYVWIGKNVNLTKRRIAIKLGKELWEEGFNYSDCLMCPITMASFAGIHDSADGVPESAKKGKSRPSWVLFAKLTQNMETVLFREKFLDWPNHLRVIRKQKSEVNGKKDLENKECFGHVSTNLDLPDPEKMLENVLPLPDLILEGTHLGRGLKYCNEETGLSTEITTKNVTTWHVNEFEYSEIPQDSDGQFHMGDSYVVRWHYIVTVTGRSLGGLPSKHLTTGRDRYAYFCWQGQESPINDRGAAACLTVELDKENGPQVRVAQGFEPPAFLNLFRGRMVVHEGDRFSQVLCERWRLFFSRGETETESVLFEVPCKWENFRSAASLVLLNAALGKIVVWHGSKSGEHQKKVAMAAAKNIQNYRPAEFKFSSSKISFVEEIENAESIDFLNIFNDDNRKLYYNISDKDSYKVTTPRLFYLSSFSDRLQSTEIASPYLGEKEATPFPFLQSDLYSTSQPALFLLDAESTLWLWQGWQDDDLVNDRGSGNVRFQNERRAAMSTALSYWNQKYGKTTSPNVYLIWAGLEPLVFINQFPFWTKRDDVSRLNMKEGRKPGDMIPVNDELENLTRTFYPLLQLQSRPLPEGVNPNFLEDYLKPHYFQELFGLEREEFFKMPSWKKKKLKKEAGLF